MYWGYVFLSLTVATLGAAAFLRDMMSFLCVIALLGWLVAANATYEYGVVERDATLAYIGGFLGVTAYLTKVYKHWLPLALFGTGLAVVAWALAYKQDYNYDLAAVQGFKEMRNGLYASGLVQTWANFSLHWSSRLPSA